MNDLHHKPDCRNNYIIAIGIDRYEHPDLENFACCVRDCTTVIRILKSDYGFRTIDRTYHNRDDKEGTEQENVLYDSGATIQNIRDLFKNLRYHPDFSRKIKGGIDHNLVIYFSGHGLVSTLDIQSLYWVPSDYTASLDSNDLDNGALYSLFNELIPDLAYIRYHHLLLVSDSCYSAAVFDPIKFFEDQTKEPEGISRGEQRSAWGLCSSASNQVSKSGRKLSLFTHHLTSILEANTNDSLPLWKLFGLVDDRMKGVDQRSFCRRLRNIPGNTGELVLEATPEKVNKSLSTQLGEYLKPGIQVNLNFLEERKNIRKLRKPESHLCAIFSGTQDHAPRLLMKIILSDDNFEYDKNTPLINPLDGYSGPDMTSMVLNVFSLAGITGCSTEDQLVAELTKVLNTGNFLLKLFFPEEIAERVGLIGELVRIISRVRDQRPSRKLVIMILDEDHTQYQEQLAQQGPLQFIFMDKIGAISRDDFDDWYSAQRQLLQLPGLATFLEQRVKGNSEAIVGAGDRFPRVVIEKICECAGCPEVAYSILSI